MMYRWETQWESRAAGYSRPVVVVAPNIAEAVALALILVQKQGKSFPNPELHYIKRGEQFLEEQIWKPTPPTNPTVEEQAAREVEELLR